MGSTIDGEVVTSHDYSSVSDVLAFTRYMLDGQTSFNSTTRPTLTEVSRMISRASSIINAALAVSGFQIPITQADAKAALDDWVTQKAVQYIELTQRGVGFSGEEGTRQRSFGNLAKSAKEFVESNRLAFARYGAGVVVAHSLSEGLLFTGSDAAADRLDPSDSALAQPMFERGLFNTPGTGLTTSDQTEEED
jgi:hypothetical protein